MNNQKEYSIELYQNLIKEIYRISSINELGNRIVEHLTKKLDFEYAILSIIDFESKLIKSEYYSTTNFNVIDPSKWVHKSIYTLKENNKEDADILAKIILEKITRPIFVIGKFILPELENISFKNLNEECFLFGHEKLARVFIPIVHRTVYLDENIDLELGILEAGFHINDDITLENYRIIQESLFNKKSISYLSGYVDNFAQTFYKAYLEEKTAKLTKIVEECEDYCDKHELNHIGFLNFILESFSKRLKIEFADVSLKSFESNLIDFKNIVLTYGYSIHDAQIKNFESGKGIIYWVSHNKKHYFTRQIANEDKIYFELINGIQSELALPIISQKNSKLIGIINFCSKTPFYFNSIISQIYANVVHRIADIYIQRNQYYSLKEINFPLEKLLSNNDEIYVGIVKALKEYYNSDYIAVWKRKSFDANLFELSEKSSTKKIFVLFKESDFLNKEIKNEYKVNDPLLKILIIEQGERESNFNIFCRKNNFKSYLAISIFNKPKI